MVTFPVLLLTGFTFLNLFGSSHVADFNARNKILTDKRLQLGYWYHKLLKTFSNFIADTMNWFLNSMLD